MNDLYRGGPDDDARIDVHDPASLEHWSREWKVSVAELRRTVEQVGPRVKDVRQHLVGGFNDTGPTS